MELDRDQNGRLEQALDDTMTALGEALVRHFPEAASGDESPPMVFGLRAALREYAMGWLAYNLPPEPGSQRQMGKVFHVLDTSSMAPGWYYQIDIGTPVGPFASKAEATRAAQEQS